MASSRSTGRQGLFIGVLADERSLRALTWTAVRTSMPPGCVDRDDRTGWCDRPSGLPARALTLTSESRSGGRRRSRCCVRSGDHPSSAPTIAAARVSSGSSGQPSAPSGVRRITASASVTTISSRTASTRSTEPPEGQRRRRRPARHSRAAELLEHQIGHALGDARAVVYFVPATLISRRSSIALVRSSVPLPDVAAGTTPRCTSVTSGARQVARTERPG